MHSSLFMTNQDVVKSLSVIVKGIVSRHDGTARITEESFHSLVFEAAHQRFCT